MPRLVNLTEHDLYLAAIATMVPGGKFVSITDEQAKLVPDTGVWALTDDNGSPVSFTEQPSTIDTGKADIEGDVVDPTKAESADSLFGPGARALQLAQDAGAPKDGPAPTEDILAADKLAQDEKAAKDSKAATRSDTKQGEVTTAPVQETR